MKVLIDSGHSSSERWLIASFQSRVVSWVVAVVSASIPFLPKLSALAMALEVIVCMERRADDVRATNGFDATRNDGQARGEALALTRKQEVGEADGDCLQSRRTSRLVVTASGVHLAFAPF